MTFYCMGRRFTVALRNCLTSNRYTKYLDHEFQKRRKCQPPSNMSRDTNYDRNSCWKWGKTKIKFGAGFVHLTRDTTKRLPGLKSMSYTDRLKCLGLSTLELPRLHLDLIFCHKTVFGMVAINFSDIFEFSHVNKTRWHAYKLFKSHSNNSTHYRFFCRKSC